MASGSRELDERFDGRRDRDRLGLGGPPAPHGDDDDARSSASSRAMCPVTAVLPTRLPVPTTAIEGSSKGANAGGSSRKSAPTYGNAVSEDPACEREPLDRPEHRLVGEIDDDLGPVPLDRRADVVGKRHAVVLAAAQLLRSADEHRGDELVGKLGERVADDGRIVLAVDDRERPHVLAVTSSSMAPVNLAYSSVSSEKETSLTSPWNGWRRQMSTLRSAISMTL